MSISQISFGANSPKIEIVDRDKFTGDDLDVIPMVKGKPSSEPTVKFERVPQQDNFEPSKAKMSDKTQRFDIKYKNDKPAKAPKQKSGGAFKNSVRGFVLGVLASVTTLYGANLANKPSPYIVLPVDSATKLTDIAKAYDTDLTAIQAYNQIFDISDLSDVDEIVVPSMYSNVKDEIESLQNKLYTSKITPEERTQIENRIRYLTNHQYLQDALATVYTDGKYVYYTINELGSEIPNFVRDKYKNGIPVNDFKDIFGIKDTAIRNTSTIFDWTKSSDGGYMGFSNNYLSAGNTVKVPIKDIKTGEELSNVNLFEKIY